MIWFWHGPGGWTWGAGPDDKEPYFHIAEPFPTYSECLASYAKAFADGSATESDPGDAGDGGRGQAEDPEAEAPGRPLNETSLVAGGRSPPRGDEAG